MLTKSNAFLRWAGSKQKLIPELRKYWGSGHNRYLEPFMGSAKLYFSIQPKTAILSDTNLELIETFQQVKKNPYAVHRILKTFKVSEDTYYTIRKIDPKSLYKNQRAARFIYLNKLCFNGLYRTNSSGHFNVPYCGGNNKIIAEELSVLTTASKQLQSASIMSGDFENIISKNVKKGDFVYLDPPYAVENRRIFKQYGPQTFGLDDLKRLKQLLKYIQQKDAKFLLSYAYCNEALELFNTWTIKKKFTQRNISGFSSDRRKAAEILVTNINI